MRPIDKVIKNRLVLKSPKVQKATPCATELSSLFNCWRALGTETAQCASAATALMACMATKQEVKSTGKSTAEINKWIVALEAKKQL
ncbi:hypothetical protein HK104_006664 [Borealophlyctis nickersoniae]|nr:hypothetical protein HK104_006664 [Borealophlyctis nickersoniae]